MPLLLALLLGAVPSSVKWRASFAAASAEAEATHKLLFVEFTVPGCRPCARLEAETYPDPRVQALLAGYVPVKVDESVETQLADLYGVSSSPDLFLMTGGKGAMGEALVGGAGGDIVNRITRFLSPGDLADFLRAGLEAPEVKRAKGSGIAWAKSFAEAERAGKASQRPLFIYVWNYG